MFVQKEVDLNITGNDVVECKKFSKQKDVFSILSKSLAPSIHGHEQVKKVKTMRFYSLKLFSTLKKSRSKTKKQTPIKQGPLRYLGIHYVIIYI